MMSPHSERPGALLDSGQAVRVGSGPAWRPRCGDAVQTKGSSRGLLLGPALPLHREHLASCAGSGSGS